jgi:hypothetical protein
VGAGGLTGGPRPQCRAAAPNDRRACMAQCRAAVPADRWARAAHCWVQKISNNPNLIQTRPNLLRSKRDLSMLQKFKIKYGLKVFEIRNNFPYKDSLKFKMDFE